MNRSTNGKWDSHRYPGEQQLVPIRPERSRERRAGGSMSEYKMVGIINGKTICKKSSLKTWWRSYIIYSISQITTIPNITAEVRNRCFASSPGGKRMADAEDITEHLVLVGQRKWCDLCAVEVRLYDEGLRGCSGWRRVNNGVMIASRRFAKQ